MRYALGSDFAVTGCGCMIIREERKVNVHGMCLPERFVRTSACAFYLESGTE